MSFRCGCVGYATEQGLAHLMRAFYQAGVVTDPLLVMHSRPNYPEWYPEGTPQIRTRPPYLGKDIDEWIRRIDAALFIETPFDWTLADRVRAAGKRVCIMPMYEWYLRGRMGYPWDAVLCPSRLDVDYFKPVHGERTVLTPVPVPQDTWRLRTRARRWLHNAGNVGWRCHKGTVELLKAVPLVKSKDWRMTVRAQDANAFEGASREAQYAGDWRVTLEIGRSLPYHQLWDGYDVLIAPEKLNGLSLPLQEGRAAGMLVMTTDRYPTNTWLPKDGLIPVHHYERACTTPNYLEFDEAIVEPEAIAAKIDACLDRDITAYSESARDYVRENSWEVLKPLYLKTLAGE